MSHRGSVRQRGERVIKLLKEGKARTIGTACSTAGISRSSLWRLAKEDNDFAERYRVALEYTKAHYEEVLREACEEDPRWAERMLRALAPEDWTAPGEAKRVVESIIEQPNVLAMLSEALSVKQAAANMSTCSDESDAEE